MLKTKFIQKEFILLAAILLIGGFLRFYKLGTIPSGLYVDEAVTGYNSYSIAETGKDEYGKSLPIAFRFFGSYSPPLYTYLASAVIHFRGFDIFAVRFVSALFGTLGILIVYLFLKNLKLVRSKSAPIIVTFLFALTPWAIFFSRAGYELNLGFILLSLGTLFLWLSFKKPHLFLLAFPILSMATYGAHPERFLVPPFIFLFLIFFRKELFRRRGYVISGLIIALIIQIPNLYLLTTPAFFTKSDLFFEGALNIQALKISKILPIFVSYPLAFLREFLSRFSTYFSPRSLFLLEDPDPQRAAPELSLFYLWVIIPYLIGLYVLFKNWKDLGVKFILFLAAVFTLPLAFTSDPFSSQRGLHLLLPLTLVFGLGTDYMIERGKKVAVVLLVVVNFASLVFLWRSYFVLLPYERARIWGYGFSQLAGEIAIRPGEHFLIDQSRIKPAYIELAFFLKYPPNKLQESVDKRIREEYYSNTGFDNSYRFANIETRNIEWEKDIYRKQILVGDEFSVSENQAKEHFLSKVFEIQDPTGAIVFIGFATDPARKCSETGSLSLYCNKVE